jgi:DNA-binding MarR family transcriptional regulator
VAAAARWARAERDLKHVVGISANELLVLTAIAERPATQTAVALARGKNENVVTKLTNSLQDKGLLNRTKGGDTRYNTLEITDKGRELVKAISEKYFEAEPTTENLNELRQMAKAWLPESDEPPKKKKK